MRFKHVVWTIFALPMCLGGVSACVQEARSSIQLQFPVECDLDQDCFIQQFTDMDSSEGVVDPFCADVSYDGHKGTDIRLRRLRDIEANVPVLAAADGTVKGVRRNVADRLLQTAADRRAVKSLECGNGVVIDHGNNIETQYCHLKQNSSAVKIGDSLKAGDTLGYVGASGLTQFPHLHFSVRKDGQVLDPYTGQTQSQGCTVSESETWWADKSILKAKRDTILLDSNIAGGPVNYETMVQTSPPKANSKDEATVGWVWYSNLKADDRVFMKLEGPNGFQVERVAEPLDRNKATWTGFVGRKREPQIGTYTLTTYVLRKDDNGSAKRHALSEKTIMVER